MKGFRVKKGAWALAALFPLIFGGCFVWSTDRYAIFHATVEDKSQLVSSDDDAEVKLLYCNGNNFYEREAELLARGYSRLGYSEFSELHCPWGYAIDQARRIGAETVLLQESFAAHVATGPSLYTVTSDTCKTPARNAVGTVREPHYNDPDRYGQLRTKYYQVAVYFKKTEDVHDEDATLRGSAYGVFIRFPNFLPGDDPDEAVDLRVQAVTRGSFAWHDGVRRGDIVEKVNGRALASRHDVHTFLLKKEKIRSVTVKKASVHDKHFDEEDWQ